MVATDGPGLPLASQTQGQTNMNICNVRWPLITISILFYLHSYIFTSDRNELIFEGKKRVLRMSTVQQY
jgi:hypothetical protein